MVRMVRSFADRTFQLLGVDRGGPAGGAGKNLQPHVVPGPLLAVDEAVDDLQRHDRVRGGRGLRTPVNNNE